MRISDFGGERVVISTEDLDGALQRRFNGFNAFWLMPDESKYPTLSIVVNGDLAALHYFPKERHAGFQSVGSASGFTPEEATVFYVQNLTETDEIRNSAVVPFSTAVAAAHEFRESPRMPKSLEWVEL